MHLRNSLPSLALLAAFSILLIAVSGCSKKKDKDDEYNYVVGMQPDAAVYLVGTTSAGAVQALAAEYDLEVTASPEGFSAKIPANRLEALRDDPRVKYLKRGDE